MACKTINMVTSPASGIPAAPMAAAVAVTLTERNQYWGQYKYIVDTVDKQFSQQNTVSFLALIFQLLL